MALDLIVDRLSRVDIYVVEDFRKLFFFMLLRLDCSSRGGILDDFLSWAVGSGGTPENGFLFLCTPIFLHNVRRLGLHSSWLRHFYFLVGFGWLTLRFSTSSRRLHSQEQLSF